MGFDVITAAISFMKPLARLLITNVAMLVFTAVAVPTGGAAAEMTNSTLPATTNLFMRTFKVDPNVFIAGLRSVADPRKPTGLQTTNVSEMARSFFTTLGVNLESPKGKAVYYNETRGVLFVKATEDDLDTIERASKCLTKLGPQIHIKARFLKRQRERWMAFNIS